MTKTPDELGNELDRLLKAEDEAADGVHDGLGETESALFYFVLENGAEIARLLKSWSE